MKKSMLCIALLLSVFVFFSCENKSAITPNPNANLSIEDLVEDCQELVRKIDAAIESQESIEYDDSLSELINTFSGKVETLKLRVKQSTDKYNENNDNVESLEKLIDTKTKSKDELQKEIDDLQKDKDDLIKQNDDLQKQKELLEKDIIVEKAKPIQLSAGQYFVGEDFPAGRYKIYDSLGHFYLYGSNGNRKTYVYFSDVDDDLYVTEYIYKLDDGDKIECDAKFKIVRID